MQMNLYAAYVTHQNEAARAERRRRWLAWATKTHKPSRLAQLQARMVGLVQSLKV